MLVYWSLSFFLSPLLEILQSKVPYLSKASNIFFIWWSITLNVMLQVPSFPLCFFLIVHQMTYIFIQHLSGDQETRNQHMRLRKEASILCTFCFKLYLLFTLLFLLIFFFLIFCAINACSYYLWLMLQRRVEASCYL